MVDEDDCIRRAARMRERAKDAADRSCWNIALATEQANSVIQAEFGGGVRGCTLMNHNT